MEKRSKEALRRYKKSRHQAESSSDSSSSSDSDSSGSSYSSSESDRHRLKKARQAQAGASRRSSSSSACERRKREKREHCQKKLEAKRNHLKRKLKEAKLKKRAAEAAAALSGHSHRALSPATQLKLKKLAERKHQRAASKERREREREKHRAALRDREREHHRGGTRSPKITKIRIHQDVKRQKSPPRMHHALMSREKIIIQTRTRERTPSPTADRRHEHKIRQDELARERDRRDRERERAEREAARDKERAEALARCQERQRERERLAREKLRREEEEKKYGMGVDRGERLLPRPAERDLAIAASRGYNSRERSLEVAERARHLSKRDLDIYERERDYLEAERRGLLDREELRREREYMSSRRRELSPVGEHYPTRIRDPRDLYAEEERERAYSRGYLDDVRHPRERDTWQRDPRNREIHEIRDSRVPRDIIDPRDPRDPREFRELEHDLVYPDERERLLRNRERAREEWKGDWDAGRDHDWNDAPPSTGRGGFIGGPKRGAAVGVGNITASPPKPMAREQRASSEPDWDADELPQNQSIGSGTKLDTTNVREAPNFSGNTGQRDTWDEHESLDTQAPRDKPAPGRTELTDRRWHSDWREEDESQTRGTGNTSSPLHQRSERGGRNFRRGGGATGLDHGDRNVHGPRSHPPPLMTLPVQPPAAGFHGNSPRFPNKRNMTYTNPNLIKKQQAALAAAKAAAQASAVAAASTAVAAAKAAAQSAANATTNPSILGQASGIRQQQDYVANERKAETGELIDLSKIDSAPFANCDLTKTNNSLALEDGKAVGELSEISDSDDDILNKTEKKSKAEADESVAEPVKKAVVVFEQDEATRSNNDAVVVEDKAEDDEMLDFEEISDGELEEDARNKGVGDALGVDWASLIAETKRHGENTTNCATEQPTTAKQKWQPHRVILDIGISMSMAGDVYAKRLLNDSKQKLIEESNEARKGEIKDETVSTQDKDLQAVADIDENTSEITDKKPNGNVEPQKALDELGDATFNIDRLHPIACIQVAERQRRIKEHKLITNACGAHSRALSARQDLKLRRQLCNLPAKENDVPRPIRVSAKIKAMALSAFRQALEVK